MSRIDLVRLDEILVGRYDAAIDEGTLSAGRHLTCHLGCTECCVGVFDITALDADRLRRGVEELARESPNSARRLRARARIQWRQMAPRFPGDRRKGHFTEDEKSRDRFCDEFSELPCPVLDETTGACLLYAYRPLTCRSYGLPLRLGKETLSACHLNFREATARETEEATVSPDPEDLEGALLSEMEGRADTVIAAALAQSQQPPARRSNR